MKDPRIPAFSKATRDIISVIDATQAQYQTRASFLILSRPRARGAERFWAGPRGEGFEFELPTKGGGDTAVASAMGLSRGVAFNGLVTARDFAPGEVRIEALSLGTQTRQGPFFFSENPSPTMVGH